MKELLLLSLVVFSMAGTRAQSRATQASPPVVLYPARPTKTQTVYKIATPLPPEMDPLLPYEVRTYAEQLYKYIRQPGRKKFAAIFQSGNRAAEILQNPRREDQPSFLEEFEYGEADIAVSYMAGFQRPGYFLYALVPDWDWFHTLVMEKGTAVDRQFFALVQKARKQEELVGYIDSDPDLGGACAAIGSDALSNLYGEWERFKHDFPADYQATVKEQQHFIARALLESKCFCSDKASVVREFQRFIQTYPYAPEVARLRGRLEYIQANYAQVSFKCREED